MKARREGAAIILAGLALGAGCQPSAAVRGELGLMPARESIAVGELMGASDRARLETLVAVRGGMGDAEYRIGPDDLLDIRIPDLLDAQAAAPAGAAHLGSAAQPIAGAPVFQQGFRVSASGVVTIPMIGAVSTTGLTPAGLEAEIARRLIAAGVLRAPQVSVQVAEYRSRVVAVVGAVERPGPYPVTKPGATVADLIWAAGGPSRDAGRVVEFVPAAAVAAAPAPTPARETPPPAFANVAGDCTVGAGTCAATLELRDVRMEGSGSVRAVVLVLSRPPTAVHQLALDGPPRLVIDIDGPVASEGRATQHVPVTDALVTGVRASLREGQLRAVLDLREVAGAVTVRAEGSRVLVEMGGEHTARPVMPQTTPPAADTARATGPIHMDLENLVRATPFDRGSLNPQVRPGDVISLRPAGSVLVDGWVDKPGSYPVTRGLTLTGAVAAAGGHIFAADRHHATVKRVLGGGEQRSITVDLDAVARGEAADIPITDGDVVRLPASMGRMIPYGMWTVAREIVHVGGNVLLF